MVDKFQAYPTRMETKLQYWLTTFYLIRVWQNLSTLKNSSLNRLPQLLNQSFTNRIKQLKLNIRLINDPRFKNQLQHFINKNSHKLPFLASQPKSGKNGHKSSSLLSGVLTSGNSLYENKVKYFFTEIGI